MTIQNSDFNLTNNIIVPFDEIKNIKYTTSENYCIPNSHTFIFEEQKNSNIKKQIVRKLGEKRDLWMK